MAPKNSRSEIPKSLRPFIASLVRPAESRFATAAPAATAAATVTDYAFNGLTSQDLSFDTSQYPVAGTYKGITPPWLNDLQAVPLDWQNSPAHVKFNVQRTKQTDQENAYVQANVPGQQYSGTTTAEIVQQWYTQGMWDPDPALFPPKKVETLTQNWIHDDQEFARQRLGGANPDVITLAVASRYDIASWIGQAVNGSDLSALRSTLLAAQGADELFVCDYRQVIGPAVTNRYVVNGRFLEAPVCFFTVDTSNNTLVPAAIQVQGTDPSSYIFTPGDPKDPDGDAWLLAKLWTASADQQWWFSGSHLLTAHSVDMIFAIAALNQIQTNVLSEQNAMLKLAKPFLTQVFNINDAVINAPGSGEKGIYQNSGDPNNPNFCDAVLPTGRIGLYQIITDLYQPYSFDDAAHPQDMKKRGLDQGPITDVIFPYRDDAQIWWDAISAFVTNVVNSTYQNDSEVAADKGLNGWMNLVEKAFNQPPAPASGRFTWTPTKERATSVFTTLLFVCSARHTAVHDTMLPGWVFTPNGPFAMMAAAPANAASVTQKVVLDSLPNPQDASDLATVIQGQITFVMSGTAMIAEAETAGMSPTDVNVMLKAHGYASGSPQAQAVADFWNAIWTGSSSVKAQVQANQNARIKTWTGSTPVPNSLAYYYLSAQLSPCVGPEYLNSSTMTSIQI